MKPHLLFVLLLLFPSVAFSQSTAIEFYSSNPLEAGSIRGNSKNISSSDRSTLRIGDDARNRSVRALLSFDTSTIPDNAIIQSAVLSIASQTRKGKDPIAGLGKIVLAIRGGFYGTSSLLEPSDFSASASQRARSTLNSTGASAFSLPAKMLTEINKQGKTQLRLYTERSTNRDFRKNLVKFYTNAASNSHLRPRLLVNYTIAGVGNDNPSTPQIWRPSPGTSWQWQLSGTIDTSFNVLMYDIDLFTTSIATIDNLHARGIKVICYFSAGSYENFRPDAAQFPQSVLGKPNGWVGERWLDIRQISTLAPIMRARLDLAVSKGCDGVEPDNVDGYVNNTGFPLSGSDQLAYNRWLASESHSRFLSVGLKNDLGQISQLVNDFDWALNEQCFEFDECSKLNPFVQANKAVFGVEYTGSTSDFCPIANQMNFDWLKKNISLDAPRTSCR